MPGNSPSLMEALTMYKQAGADFANAMNGLTNQRAVNGANQAVQDIKASEKTDAQKQEAIRGIANNLTMHLTAGGDMPMDRIQGIQNALSPKPPTFQNPFEAFTSSAPGAKQSAIDWEKLQSDQKIREQQANPLARLKLENEQDEFKTKQLGHVMEKANAILASSRSPLGTLQLQKQKLDKLESTLSGDPSKMTSIQQHETAADLDSVFTGGVGSDSGRSGLIPKTGMGKLAAMKEMALNRPAALNTPEFTNQYADMKDRLQNIIGQQKAAAIKQALRTNVRVANLDKDSFKDGVESLLPGDTIVSYDGKKPVFDSDVKEAGVAKVLTHILDNSGSADADAAIAQVQDHPNYIGAIENNPALANRLRAYFKAKRGQQ